MADQENKTEQPTEKRLSEARESGQFPRAPDLQTVAILAAAIWAISVMGREISENVASIAVGIFSNLGKMEIRPEAAGPWGMESMRTLLALSMPLALVCGVAAILMGGVQTGFSLSPKVLEVKFDRLDPIAGFQRIFSMQGLVRVGLDSLRLTAGGWVIYGGLQRVMADPIFYTPVPLGRLGGFIAESAVVLLWRCVLALGLIAALITLFVVFPLKGQAIAHGGAWWPIARTFILTASWGLGTSILLPMLRPRPVFRAAPRAVRA